MGSEDCRMKSESLALKRSDLQIEEDGGVEGGEAVADGQAEPDAIELREPQVWDDLWQDEQGRHEEDELAREREVDALAGLTDALEEIACDHLETDDGEEGYIQAHTVGRDGDEIRVGGESFHDEFGKNLTYEEPRGHHQGGIADGLEEDFLDTVVLLGTVVVAGDGLHPLVEAHDDHGEEEEHAVDDAVGAHGQVAAIFHHAAVDEQHNEARAGVHQERREADAEDTADDVGAQRPGVTTHVHNLRRAREDPQLPRQRDALRDDGGDGGTLDAQSETVDEQRVEGGVEQHREDSGKHCRAGMPGGAQDGIEAEVEMGEDVAIENPLHILAGIGEGLVGSPEEAEDGIEESQNEAHEQDAHEDVQRHAVAEIVLCFLAVLLTQAHTDHRGGADADHRAEGGAEVHQREGDGQTRDGHGAYALANEHAIDHVVQR